MPNRYFARYKSPNIVIVPTVNLAGEKKSLNTIAVAANAEPSNVNKIDTKNLNVLSEISNNSLVNNEKDLSKNVLNIDSVEEALKRLHNIQTYPTEKKNVYFFSNSKFVSQSNLKDLTNTNIIQSDKGNQSSSVNKINKQVMPSKDTKVTEDNEKHVPNVINSNITEKTKLRQLVQNSVEERAKESKNSSITSYKIEKKVKNIQYNDQKKFLKSVMIQSDIKSHSNSSCKRNKKQEYCNDKDEYEKCLHKNEELKTKANSKNYKNHIKQLESSAQHKLTLSSKELKQEYENIKSKKEFKYASISHEEKNDKTSGALKRYLDYQRFLGKYYNNTIYNKNYEEKNKEKTCLIDPNACEEVTTNYLKNIKDNEASLNVKSIMKENKTKERIKIKSTIERVEKKQESKKKLDSYIVKKRKNKHSNRQCDDKNLTINNERKKSKEDCDKKATKENLKKEEEIKIKLTTYLENNKKKEKVTEKINKHPKQTERDKKLTNCLDKKGHVTDNNEGSRNKSQKESNRKTSTNSKRKKVIDKTAKKVNKIKELKLKRKHNESKQEITLESKKYESPNMNSCSKKRRQTLSSPIRIVDVIKETSCHTLSNNYQNINDLRSKLTRKRTRDQCKTDFVVKSPTARENLLVTLKQNIQAKSSVHNKTATKPKVKKWKKIKLVINIKCQNSGSSDEMVNESEHESVNENTSPHLDLSFLDDIDIDGIVDSLNAGQKLKSPTRENKSGAEREFYDDDYDIIKNNPNTNVALKKDCQFKAFSNDKSNIEFNNNVIKPETISTKKTKINLNKECNDDMYEVIDITDEVVTNTISGHNDTSIISMDQKANTKQSIVSHTNFDSKSIITIRESRKNVQRVPISNINEGVNAKINETELLDAKHSTAQEASVDVNTIITDKSKVVVTQNPNASLSNVTMNPRNENGNINFNSYYGQQSESGVDSNSYYVDNPNIKEETHDANINLLTNIENADQVTATNIKQEANNELFHHLKTVKKEASNETTSFSKIIKSKDISVRVQSNINLKYDKSVSANEINLQHPTVLKYEKTNCALSEFDNNSQKNSNYSTVIEVNQSVHTETNINKKKEIEESKAKTLLGAANDEVPFTKTQLNLENNELKYDDIAREPVVAKLTKEECVLNNGNAMMTTTSENNSLVIGNAPPIKLENKIWGNLTKADINTMENHMLQYLHKKYTVLDFVHRGYFSNIYKCKGPDGGFYAIKVLKRRFLSMGIYKDRLLTGLQEIAKTDGHFNFSLEIISKFYIQEKLCLLTEYYPKTLAQELANNNYLHIDVVQTLSRQLVSAVSKLTCNNIIHSDIKPNHILLSSTIDRLKLCGFDRADYNYNIKITPSTGTASYRAPEIILGFEADYKIDVWATGLVMYEMASGTQLFPGRYNNDILYKQICTLGPVHIDMLVNGSQVYRHFFENKFKWQIGAKEWIYIEEFPVRNGNLYSGLRKANENRWAPGRTIRQTNQEAVKIEMLHQLLEQMLCIHPHYRLSITDVACNDLLFYLSDVPTN